MAKLSRAPKKKIDDFLDEPERGAQETPKPAESKSESPKKLVSTYISYPWEGKSERVMKGINLRLTEIQHEKLKFIYKQSTEKSLQKLIMSVLEPFIDKRVEELTEEREV